jgi:sulfofructose kinase
MSTSTIPARRSDEGVRIHCVGALSVDRILEVDSLPTGEGKQIARASRTSGGGMAGTAAMAVAALGASATWSGRVGDDAAGSEILAEMRSAGIDIGAGSVVGGTITPVGHVLVDPVGNRWLGWLAGTASDSPAVEAVTADAVLVDQALPELAISVLRTARAAGIPRVLDLEDGNLPRTAEIASLCDHVVFSADGLASYTSSSSSADGLRAASERHPDAVLGVTNGPAGSAWLIDGEIVAISAPSVAARDTTGAGDVFHGAFTLAIAERMPLRDAIRFATAAAALKVERGDGWNGMPTRLDTEAVLTRGTK